MFDESRASERLEGPDHASPTSLVSRAAAAEFLGISTRSLSRHQHQLGIVPVRIGRRVLYRLECLQRVAGNRANAQKEKV
jgi:hypothetical protein